MINPIISEVTYDTLYQFNENMIHRPHAYHVSTPLGGKHERSVIIRTATTDFVNLSLNEFLPSFFEISAAIAILSAKYTWEISVWIISLISFSAAYSTYTSRFISSAQKEYLKARMASSRSTVTLLTNFENILYFNTIQHELNQLKRVTSVAQQADLKNLQTFEKIAVIHALVTQGLYLGLIVYAGKKVLTGEYELSDLSIIVYFLRQLSTPLDKLSESLGKLYATIHDLAPHIHLLKIRTSEPLKPRLQISPQANTIRFEHVSFCYNPECYVLTVSSRPTVEKSNELPMYAYLRHQNQLYYKARNQIDLLNLSEDALHDFDRLLSPTSIERTLTLEELRQVNLIIHHQHHNNEIIFQDISFAVPSGTTVALVGMSGGGKTTILRLLYRLYNPTAGRITINNQDISAVDLSSLRNNLAIVQQNPILFNNTLRYNIAYGAFSIYGEQVPNELILEAVEKAGLRSFVDSLPEGLERKVGENGLMISGGQLLRIAIARALVRKASIILLDEYTAALDSETEMFIQQNLEVALQGKIKIIIAHRLSTIRNADHIIVLGNQNILEQGSFSELMNKRGFFNNLWSTQRNQRQAVNTSTPAFFQPELEDPSTLAGATVLDVAGLDETVAAEREDDDHAPDETTGLLSGLPKKK